MKGSGQPQWRELGKSLAHALGQSNGAMTTPARLQGLVADVAAEHTELLMPLKELVSRPAFQALVPKAGSGSGVVQRDVLIQDLEATFSLPVISALAELLDGFLDLPPGSTGHGEVVAEGATQPDPSSSQPGSNQPPAHAPPRSAPEAVPLRPADSASLAPQPEQGGIPVMRLAMLSLATAIAVAVGLMAVRSTDLCALVGLCPGVQVSGRSAQDLEAAEQAVQDLRQASTLGAYEGALVELDRHLLKLSTAKLTPEQEQRREQLDQAARQARGVLAEEQTDARRLKKASEALASAPERMGDQQESLIAVAAEELDAIPPRSFSASGANRLRRQLEQLKRDLLVNGSVQPEAPPESAEEALTPPSALPPTEPPQPARVRPSPPSAPVPQPRPERPATQPAPPAQSDNDAPYRDQPLF